MREFEGIATQVLEFEGDFGFQFDKIKGRNWLVTQRESCVSPSLQNTEAHSRVLVLRQRLFNSLELEKLILDSLHLRLSILSLTHVTDDFNDSRRSSRGSRGSTMGLRIRIILAIRGGF